MRKRRQALVVMAAVAVVGTGCGFAGAPAGEVEVGIQRIVVSIPHRKLAVIRDGEIVKTYATAVGAPNSPSPVGEFAVINRIVRPTYYAHRKVIRPGRFNPLGTRWMGLDIKGYGIHGTNVPKSIGKAESHGCIRLSNRDVEELFELVRVGDAVELHGQADEVVVALFGPTADDESKEATLGPEAKVAGIVAGVAALVRL
jgi:hypothetical protein